MKALDYIYVKQLHLFQLVTLYIMSVFSDFFMLKYKSASFQPWE